MQGLSRSRRVGTDHSGARLLAASVTLFAFFAGPHRAVRAGELTAEVRDPHGHAIAGIVIVAEPQSPTSARRVPRTAVMDQRHMQFVPEILVIQTGSSVDFPNSDGILHQVYSFSAAKAFQLSLYAGHHYPPVLFDRAGLVTVGCNIHDQMIGYIYVTDSPYFGRTDQTGRLQLHDLPAGRFTVKAWSPALQGTDRQRGVQTVVDVPVSGEVQAHLQLSHAVRGDGTMMMMDKRWADY